VRIQKGMNIHKKISYSNFTDKSLYLAMESNFPNILKIKSQNIEVEPKGQKVIFKKKKILILIKKGKNYIRLKFLAPDIFCKITVKMAVIDKEEMFIRDLLMFEIEVFK
jgi:hypothetical protein